MSPGGWIGVDLDGTLAEYHGWNGGKIGPPIPAMLGRIHQWIAQDIEVRIVTARACEGPDACAHVQDWLERECRLPRLQVTNAKDFCMVELWDDRAVQVISNTGERVGEAYARRGP